MRITDFFKREKIDLTKKKLLLAASGGPDSMALLDMLEKLRHQFDFDLLVAHFNHQLREDSEEENKLLQLYCTEHSLPLFTAKWAKKDQPQHGVEAAARKVRYSFLTQVAQKEGVDYLLTAHHGDDLIENILLKFIRSGNPEEMNSLRAVGQMNGVPLLRPLLEYDKQKLLEYDRRLKINYVIDSTNQEDNTLRNRLRHHVVPFLKKENPNLLTNALYFNQEMNNLVALVDQQTNKIAQLQPFLGVAYRVAQAQLADLTKNERIIFWQRAIWHQYQRRVNQNLGKFRVVEYQHFFYLFEDRKAEVIEPFAIQLNQPFKFHNRHFVLSLDPPQTKKIIGDFWLEPGKKLMAGSLASGSKLCLKNGQHVKAKKKFAESAIPDVLRPFCLAIYAEEKPVFVEKTYQNQDWIKNGRHYFVCI